MWVLDWYNFIVQHNPTPTPERGGFVGVKGKGNAYENPLRDKSHGRIWRVVSRTAPRYDAIALDKENPDDLIDALSNDNMFWRMTAQRLLVERGNVDVLPDLFDLVTNKKAVIGGNDVAAIHALWAIDGLGGLAKDDKAEGVLTAALSHPSPGVRKAAIQILSKSHWTEESLAKSNVLNDADPNTRLAAILSLTEVTSSESIGQKLYELSTQEEIKNDEWLSKAVYAAATQHRKGFMTAFLAANPGYLNEKATEKKREAASFDDAGWKSMALPQYFEAAGVDIDGLIWFRKVIDLGAGAAGKQATISLGPVNDSDITYINGIKVGGMTRTRENRVYNIASGILKPGRNLIAVRVEDLGGNGGLNGEKELLFLQVGGKKVSLSGDWKYEVEKEVSRNQSMFVGTSIGKLFADNYLNTIEAPVSAPAAGAVVVKIKVVKNEMKYDVASFTVEAGKPVEIIFENPDFMQHNLLITQIGSLQTVGKAADKLAADPRGAEMNYVPNIPEVLFSTKLVNPQKSETLRFTAPEKPGDYPFVCTFPGHWSIMNGTMKVTAAKAL